MKKLILTLIVLLSSFVSMSQKQDTTCYDTAKIVKPTTELSKFVSWVFDNFEKVDNCPTLLFRPKDAECDERGYFNFIDLVEVYSIQNKKK